MPTCMGLAGMCWVPPEMGWEGLRGVQRAGARRAPALCGCGILCAPHERADVGVPPRGSSPCVTYGDMSAEPPFTASCSGEKDAGCSLSIQGIQVHVHPSHLISSFFSFLRMRGSRQTFLNLFCILWLTLLLKAASSSPLPHGNDPPAPSLPSGLYKGHTCVGMYSGFVCLLD